MTQASHAHLGGLQIYQSTDPDLFDQFGVDPASGSVIISMKDHQVAPETTLHLSADMTVRSLERWLNRHRFPSAFELTAGNFYDVMRSNAADLVVLTAVGPLDGTSAEVILAEASKAWNRRNHDPSVLFVWMDFERWETWLKNMYGVKSIPSVILADHKASQAVFTYGFISPIRRSIFYTMTLGKLTNVSIWTLSTFYPLWMP